jgi:PIN domain nuclease of toxin-antitoxin system
LVAQVKLLLDTHIWLWAELDPEKIGKRLQAKLREPDAEVWLSPISVWEFLLLAERGRIAVQGKPEDWVETAFQRSPLREAALNNAVALASRSIQVPHHDPADRFLAATAQVYGLTLVTDDTNLLRGKGYSTLSNR